MDWMIMLAQLLLSLSFLVAVHEMGHLLAAKYFGMRVEQFSIGFPPKIWSFKKGETEYALSAIPLGGYVKISGMIDESLDTDAMKAAPQPWEFRSKPAWQRLIVMLGGIFVNVIIGIMIFIGITFVYGDSHLLKDEVNKNGGFAVGTIGEDIGLKSGDKIVKLNGKDYQYIDELVKAETLLSNGSYTVDRNGKLVTIDIPANFIQNFNNKQSAANFIHYRFAPIISSEKGAIVEGSIADLAHLQAGDRFIEVNGVPVIYQDEVVKLVNTGESKAITFKILRNNVVHAYKGTYGKERMIGFHAAEPKEFFAKAEHVVKYNFGQSITLGTQRAFTTLFTQIKAFGKVISGVLSPRKSISGPIGIMEAFGNDWNWERFWSLTGVLSLVLAFMNLLPIPALDGGHVAFLSYEIVSRRKPSDKFLEVAQKVGMVILLSLMVFVFANDIIKKVEHLF
jgi:regulator of sigma E protease